MYSLRNFSGRRGHVAQGLARSSQRGSLARCLSSSANSSGSSDDWGKKSSPVAPVFKKRAVLEMADGTVYEGTSFGADTSKAGEVVFTTAMVGYPESLTDPSFQGQLLNFTTPMLGNYGVPCTRTLDEFGLHKFLESDRIHAAGVLAQDYSVHYSHWNAKSSLSEWLQREGVPGIFGVDTRAITKKIRAEGAMLGRILVDDVEVPFVDPNKRNLVAEVSTKKPRVFGQGNPIKILAVDCGIKNNMIRMMVQRGAEVKLVPYNYDVIQDADWYDGVFVSNGPGDPSMLEETVRNLKKVLDAEGSQLKPVFGICLGNQLLGRAAGAETFKLGFGHRGHNQPVTNLLTGRCFITPQNHGFALDGKQLPPEWTELCVNGNDGTNEGIIHTTKPFFTAQFHPEHMGGPTDSEGLFDTFLHAAKAQQRTSVMSSFVRREVPRPEVSKVLVLGSGGLSIGQAGEFDYSGSQAIKALKEEGLEVVLVNPNIASVQTNVTAAGKLSQADNVYYLPVTPEFVEHVIEREKPTGIVISMGGQTALNCGLELHHKGIFDKYGVQVLGTPIHAIEATEDRDIFSEKLKEINEKIAPSLAVNTIDDAVAAAGEIGYPCMIRSAYALGGLGSGICTDEAHLRSMAKKALTVSPQILVEKSLTGWKEVEYEVVRDAEDNCITVCNMENFDPLGIHTGDSIVVAPSQTLSNREYHMLRETALKVVRHLGIVGECNIQYALNPASEEYCIIEVNARLSRSSALASKATGYPLAFVAAKLGLGKTLPELTNSVTRSTTACFEPSLDYIVTKIPRWDLAKFSKVSTDIGSAMKSVGEVMAIGRTFEESVQKAMRMVDPSIEGFEPLGLKKALHKQRQQQQQQQQQLGGGLAEADPSALSTLSQQLRVASDKRMFSVAECLRSRALSVDQVHALTKIDPWFLHRLQAVANLDQQLSACSGGAEGLSHAQVLQAKRLGFSDRQIAMRLGQSEDAVRQRRTSLGIRPLVKQIDTLAAEYPAQTNYLYTTYVASENDVPAVTRSNSNNGSSEADDGIVVLGSGAYRIGSSVEFDWCAVSCIRTLREMGKRTVMINYNPETVSTDYDECDQLYFEEISRERVLDIYEQEAARGVIVSVGGQIPNNLALPLHRVGANVLGTSPEMIDNAEDRKKFSNLMDSIGVRQPEWEELSSVEEAKAFADRVGYPVLVRPSYVLSGAAMRVVYGPANLERFLTKAGDVSGDHPVVISKFIENAREIELDAVAQNGEIVASAVSEHVENAGVHSGDATLVLPVQDSLPFYEHQVRECGAKIARALQISGPFNAQFIAKGADVLVIECNLRASRSFPFVSKTVSADFIEAATRVIVGEDLVSKQQQDPSQALPGAVTSPVPALPSSSSLGAAEHREQVLAHHKALLDAAATASPTSYVAVKAPMFSYTRLRGADPVLGVEMASTGEVACFGKDLHEAFLKSMMAANFKLPNKAVLISVQERLAHDFVPVAHQLTRELGLSIYATKNTYETFRRYGIPCKLAAFPSQEGEELEEESESAASASASTKPNHTHTDTRARAIKSEAVAAAGQVNGHVNGHVNGYTNGETNGLNGAGPAAAAEDALDLITEGKVDLVVNLPNAESKRLKSNYLIRRTAVDFAVPLMTNVSLVKLLANALVAQQKKPMPGLDADSLFDYYRGEDREKEAWVSASEYH